VITVRSNLDKEGQRLDVGKRSGHASQRWRIAYELVGDDAFRKKGQ